MNVGGEQGKGNINLLTKDAEKKPGADGTANDTNGTYANGGSGGGSGTRGAHTHAAGEKCPPSNGVFYAYASQVGTDKKYLLTFANAKVANDYFDRVAEIHKEKAFRK